MTDVIAEHTYRVGTRVHRMHTLIMDAFSPQYIDICDESSQHRGHAGVRMHRKQMQQTHDVMRNLDETHFILTIDAVSVPGMMPVHKHRAVYQVLADEFSSGLHSLQIKLC